MPSSGTCCGFRFPLRDSRPEERKDRIAHFRRDADHGPDRMKPLLDGERMSQPVLTSPRERRRLVDKGSVALRIGRGHDHLRFRIDNYSIAETFVGKREDAVAVVSGLRLPIATGAECGLCDGKILQHDRSGCCRFRTRRSSTANRPLLALLPDRSAAGAGSSGGQAATGHSPPVCRFPPATLP